MERTRLSLHKRLKEITGLQNCYFSPPNGFNLKYPCLVYTVSNHVGDRADNLRYIGRTRYTITVITEDPDSDLSEKLVNYLDYCSLDRHFTNDNLNHFVHTLFY